MLKHLARKVGVTHAGADHVPPLKPSTQGNVQGRPVNVAPKNMKEYRELGNKIYDASIALIEAEKKHKQASQKIDSADKKIDSADKKIDSADKKIDSANQKYDKAMASAAQKRQEIAQLDEEDAALEAEMIAILARQQISTPKKQTN